MLMLSVILYLFAALGLVAMGVKYIRAEAPLDYHAEITKDETIGPRTLKVMGALYRVMGGGFLALGLLLAIIAVFGVLNGVVWAKLAIPVGALIAGGFSALVPRAVERATGVRTPWRIAAALTGVILLAFVLSLF